MIKENVLNRLEHLLLSSQVDDNVEPLFVLYGWAKKEIKGVSLDSILKALIKLVDMDFSKCYLVFGAGNWQPVEKLTFKELKKHYEGMTEKERREYPLYIHEYYFEITEKRKLEEAKAVYDAYYPE